MLEIIDEIRPRKDERGSLRKVIALLGVVCLFILLGIAATWPTKAHADTVMVYSDPQTTLTLFNKPCTNETILGYLKQQARPRYQASTLVWEGRVLQSCWRLTDDNKAVMSIDEEGDGLSPFIPLEAFKEAPSA